MNEIYSLIKFRRKGMISHLISINKTEKEAIKKAYPNAHVVRTMRQKSKRNHYYCEETPYVKRFLANLRNGTSKHVERGGRHRSEKT